MACSGAVITRDGRQYLAGVNSGNPEMNECDCGTVDQYNRVSDSYANFILPIIGGSTPARTCGNKDGAGTAPSGNRDTKVV